MQTHVELWRQVAYFPFASRRVVPDRDKFSCGVVQSASGADGISFTELIVVALS